MPSFLFAGEIAVVFLLGAFCVAFFSFRNKAASIVRFLNETFCGRIAAAMCRQVCDNVRWKRNYAKAACTL